MKIVSLNKKLIDAFSIDPEMLKKITRPFVIILNLQFRGVKREFAVPLRSNISASTPKEQYYSLPPRCTTLPNNKHGIHYLKMVPVQNVFFQKYIINDDYTKMIVNIINKNTKTIVTGCQCYLDRYTNFGKPQYATNIDMLITVLENLK